MSIHSKIHALVGFTKQQRWVTAYLACYEKYPHSHRGRAYIFSNLALSHDLSGIVTWGAFFWLALLFGST